MTEVKYRLKGNTEREPPIHFDDMNELEIWLFENWRKCAELHLVHELPEWLNELYGP